MPKRMAFCSYKVIQSKPVRPRIPKCMDVTNLPDGLLFFTVLLSPLSDLIVGNAPPTSLPDTCRHHGVSCGMLVCVRVRNTLETKLKKLKIYHLSFVTLVQAQPLYSSKSEYTKATSASLDIPT
ncbi:hypothetical protein I7I48_01943 [Histoplasma ohiense]|nr:hypothetical protein I7I48_01943 [Histoplasma ohiense (nom. inval.)]